MSGAVTETDGHSRYARRNFLLLFTEIATFSMAMSTFRDDSILPTFLSTLTDSKTVIGLVATFAALCRLVPQLWTAHYLSGRTHLRGYVLKSSIPSRLAVLAFIPVLLYTAENRPMAALAAFLLTYGSIQLVEGLIHVPIFDLIAKSIPERSRGRLLGVSGVVGSILSIFLIGPLAAYLLSDRADIGYPGNYAVLLGLMFILLSGNLLCIWFLRESPGAVTDDGGGFVQFVYGAWSTLMSHAGLRRVFAVRCLMSAGSIAGSFYMLHAKAISHVEDAQSGIFASAAMAGGIVGGLLGGYVCDHLGSKTATVIGCAMGIAAPLTLIVAGETSVTTYYAVFFLIGLAGGAMWIGPVNMVLELARPEERKTFVAVMSLASVPSFFLPALGGFLIDVSKSYVVVFAIASAGLLAACLMALRLNAHEQSPALGR